MEKNTLVRNFSRYAHLYDSHAQVQNYTASLLLQEIKDFEVNKILEIGCGTGNFTLLLKNRFEHAQIKAIDISAEMVKIAKEKLLGRKIEFVVTDARYLELSESFNLITSNACLHWFSNPQEVLSGYKKLLRRRGAVSFSLFGPRTFWELKESLNRISKASILSSGGFLDKEGISQIMRNNFSEVKIKETVFTQTHVSLKELFYKIKYTGVRGNGLNGKITFTPGFIERLEKCYLDKFKEIKATYQVFICQGKS
ncbi:MAG: methyltransferase domain-containing protein [Candidatus Omnitrophota bacterium]|nr:methyltransferase domain-containing protein [Candidatus Omnitrophota bacterium]